MLSLYSVLASKPWGHPENMKGAMGLHQKSGALLPRSVERTSRTFCLWAEMHLSHVLSASAGVQHAMLRYIHYRFGVQEKARNRL